MKGHLLLIQCYYTKPELTLFILDSSVIPILFFLEIHSTITKSLRIRGGSVLDTSIYISALFHVRRQEPRHRGSTNRDLTSG
jgi:hypothetical protein